MFKKQIIPLISLIGIVAVVWSGTAVDQYKLHVLGIQPPHPYPIQGVSAISGILVLISIILYAIIKPWNYNNSWRRALFAGLFSSGMCSLFTVLLIHAPKYIWAFVLWLYANTLFYFALTAYSLFRTLWASRSRS